MNFLEKKALKNLVEHATKVLNLKETETEILRQKIIQMPSYKQATDFLYHEMLTKNKTKHIAQPNKVNSTPVIASETYTKSKTMVLSKKDKRAAFINEMLLATITGIGLGVTVVCTIKIALVI